MDNKDQTDSSAPQQQRYIPWPQALAELTRRFDATPDDIAYWVFMGPQDGGLRAFTHRPATEQGASRERFFITECEGTNYRDALQHAYFDELEIESFTPLDTVITGQDLINRWKKHINGCPIETIRRLINESRLTDLHPIRGGTQFGNPEEADLPPPEEALFPLKSIEEAEQIEFPLASTKTLPPLGSQVRRTEVARNAALTRHSQPGGSHDKRKMIQSIWDSGRYKTKAQCARQEHEALGMAHSTAIKALNNRPSPKQTNKGVKT